MNNANLFRPCTLNDFIGNRIIVDSLRVYLYSAKKRNVSLDHILLYGNSGCGKTTLANIIANELDRKLIVCSAPLIQKSSDIVTILGHLNSGDILFIDEIHRLPKEVEEILYSAMEDFELNIDFKIDETGKVLNFDLPPFTLIGATTILGKLSLPFRNRFGITYKFTYYSQEEIETIISKNATKLNLNINIECIKMIARRSRNTPRIANNILRRLYDYSIYYDKEEIDISILQEYFLNNNIDNLGLTKSDYEIIKILYEKFDNRPVSLETIGVYISETKETIEEVYEPYLLQLSLIERTKLGRKLTNKGIEFYKKFIK